MKVYSVRYRVVINIGPFNYRSFSKVYDIEEGKSRVVPGLRYSLVNVLFGWWATPSIFNFRLLGGISDNVKALQLNFAGGEDCTKVLDNIDFDERTNYIYDNISMDHLDKLDKPTLDMILEMQDTYRAGGMEMYTEENLEFLTCCLVEEGVNKVKKEALLNIFRVQKFYED